MTQPGEPPPQLPAVRKGGLSLFVWLGIAGSGLFAFLFVGAFVFGVYRAVHDGMNKAAVARLGAPASPDESTPAPAARSLPPVARHVPKHPVAMLDGCTDGDVAAIRQSISDAIDVGAPLYNQGNFAGCYHMYEGTSVDLERRLGASCEGPRHALDGARSTAATLSSPSAQAWAMRDGFDGLLDVIARRGRGI